MKKRRAGCLAAPACPSFIRVVRSAEAHGYAGILTPSEACGSECSLKVLTLVRMRGCSLAKFAIVIHGFLRHPEFINNIAVKIMGAVFAFLIAGFVFSGAPPAAAQIQLAPSTSYDEKVSRRAVLPSIRSATDCLARAVLADTFATSAVAGGTLDSLVRSKFESCSSELKVMVSLHNSYFYPGKGEEFLKGAYMADLPRAILARIKPEIDRRKSEAAQAETIRASRIANLEKSRDLLRERAYDCAQDALKSIVGAKETADVMATAAMTICRREYQSLKDGVLEIARASGEYSVELERSIDQTLRTTVRDNVLTMAVRLKAETSSVSSRPPPQSSAQTQTADTQISNLKQCLNTFAEVQKDQMGQAKAKTEVLLKLCRPEIETLARAMYFADPKAELEDRRAEALNIALSHAKLLLGDPNPSH